jgi:hypothetical protein
MFLKLRNKLGYESVCREVADSITWRRSCRIPLDGQVPDPNNGNVSPSSPEVAEAASDARWAAVCSHLRPATRLGR